MPETVEVERLSWCWGKAQWGRLDFAPREIDWSNVLAGTASEVADAFTNVVLATAKTYIPTRRQQLQKSTHPWLNDRCRELLLLKRAAEGTQHFTTTTAQLEFERNSTSMLQTRSRSCQNSRGALNDGGSYPECSC